jgi:hypothetical protein
MKYAYQKPGIASSLPKRELSAIIVPSETGVPVMGLGMRMVLVSSSRLAWLPLLPFVTVSPNCEIGVTILLGSSFSIV